MVTNTKNNMILKKLGTNKDPLSLDVIRDSMAKMKEKLVPNRKIIEFEGFVRVKYIKGRPYYYLVKSVVVNGKIRQKVIKYLGATLPKGYKIATGKKRKIVEAKHE